MIDMNMPARAQKTEKTADETVTALKLLNTLIDAMAGKMTRADMRSEPTRFMASTMMTAIITAIRRLYAPVRHAHRLLSKR